MVKKRKMTTPFSYRPLSYALLTGSLLLASAAPATWAATEADDPISAVIAEKGLVSDTAKSTSTNKAKTVSKDAQAASSQVAATKSSKTDKADKANKAVKADKVETADKAAKTDKAKSATTAATATAAAGADTDNLPDTSQLTNADPNVPDVVDPDDALKALNEVDIPRAASDKTVVEEIKAPAPTRAKTPTSRAGSTESLPVAPEGPATVISTPEAASAAGAASAATAEQVSSDKATPDAAASVSAPAADQAAGTKVDEKANEKAEAKTDEKADPKAEAADGKKAADEIPDDQVGQGKVDYGEDHPSPEAKAAATWTDQVIAKTQPKAVPPLGHIPAFLGITPYVTTKADVEARFQKKALYADDAPLGPRHVITGDDFGLGAQTLLIGYTVDGIVSDLYVQVTADKVEAAKVALQRMTAEMDPAGLWTKVGGDSVWRDPAAELELSPDPEGGMTILYGAVARQPWETRQWLDADPNNRYPRFAGLLIGRTTLTELQQWASSRQGCQLGTPAVYPNGSFAITLKGVCFGLPKEEKSDLWFDADSHRLVRLIVSTKASADELEPVSAALAKRYVAVPSEDGVFQTGTSPARNVWMPRVKVTPQDGRLEFDVPIDGITSAQTNWEAIQRADAARRAEAHRIDQLFE